MGIMDIAVQSLTEKAGVTVLRQEGGNDWNSVVFRAADAKKLLDILKPLLQASGPSAGLTVDLSKIYTLRNDCWIYLWRLHVKGDLIRAAAAIQQGTTQMGVGHGGNLKGPILGGRRSWGQNAKGGGVMPMGKSKLGGQLIS